VDDLIRILPPEPEHSRWSSARCLAIGRALAATPVIWSPDHDRLLADGDLDTEPGTYCQRLGLQLWLRPPPCRHHRARRSHKGVDRASGGQIVGVTFGPDYDRVPTDGDGTAEKVEGSPGHLGGGQLLRLGPRPINQRKDIGRALTTRTIIIVVTGSPDHNRIPADATELPNKAPCCSSRPAVNLACRIHASPSSLRTKT
jgi:hypothetical protein